MPKCGTNALKGDWVLGVWQASLGSRVGIALTTLYTTFIDVCGDSGLKNWGVELAVRGRFRFQRFSLADDQCGMKVGIDGVLLGAWASVENAARILDIGTGCGLVALMLAQRTETQSAHIDAIEIESAAASQASDNIAQSPWRERVSVFNQSLQRFACSDSVNNRAYDLCVCNPPFFESSLVSRQPDRRRARHAISLSRETLFACTLALLSKRGRFCLILPFDQLSPVRRIGEEVGLYLQKQISVRSLPGRPFKRALLELGREQPSLQIKELTVELVHHQFTDEFRKLTRDFYLGFD